MTPRRSGFMRPSCVIISSVKPSLKYSWRLARSGSAMQSVLEDQARAYHLLLSDPIIRNMWMSGLWQRARLVVIQITRLKLKLCTEHPRIAAEEQLAM